MNSLRDAKNWERKMGLGQATVGALVLGSIVGGVTSSLALGLVAGGVVSGFGIKRMLGAKNITQDKVGKVLEEKESKIAEWNRNSG